MYVLHTSKCHAYVWKILSTKCFYEIVFCILLSRNSYLGFCHLVFQLVQVSFRWPYHMQSFPTYIHSKYCFRVCFLILLSGWFHTLQQTLKASMETANIFRLCSNCLPLQDVKCFLNSPSLDPTDRLVCRGRVKTREEFILYPVRKICQCNSVFLDASVHWCFRS